MNTSNQTSMADSATFPDGAVQSNDLVRQVP